MKISEETRSKGFLLFRTGKVKKELETDKRIHFSVQGETEKHSVIYDKERGEYSCDCQYFALKGKECSHIYACKLTL